MIITLCGSTRFEKEFHYWNEYLSVNHGHTIISLSVFPSQKETREWYTPEIKQKLDLIHLAKIEISDAIFVITRAALDERYIGESATKEITWAKLRNKIIFYDYNWQT